MRWAWGNCKLQGSWMRKYLTWLLYQTQTGSILLLPFWFHLYYPNITTQRFALSVLVFPMWNGARMISVTLFCCSPAIPVGYSHYCCSRQGRSLLGGMGNSLFQLISIVLGYVSFSCGSVSKWIGWTIKIASDVGQTGPGRNERRTAASWRGRVAGGLVYWCDWGQGQVTTVGGSAERELSWEQGETKDAFILLVNAGWENSSVDMCVSVDGVWSPGKQTRGL